MSLVAARLVQASLLLAAIVSGLARAESPVQLRVEMTEHSAAIRRIAVSPDGGLVATVGDDKTGRIWRASDHRLLAVLRVPVGEGDQGRLYGVAFSPDGQKVAVGGTSGASSVPHRIEIFDSNQGTRIKTLSLDAGNIVRLLWTRDGRHLAACLSGRDGLRIVDVDSGRLAFAETFSAPCFGLAELPDGSLLAAGWDGQIRHLKEDGGAWRLSGRVHTDVADPQSIAVSPDGHYFAVGYRSRLPGGQVAIDVFDAGSLSLAHRFAFYDVRGGGMGAVAWSADGRTIAASGRADQGDARFMLKRIAWPQRTVSTDVIASDTVLDIAPYGSGQFALASGSGSWGLVGSAGAVQPLGSSVVDVRGPDNLRADDKLLTVAFGTQASSAPFRFSLARRQLEPGGTTGLASARRLSFTLPVTQWQDELQPAVAGRPVVMEALEVSRTYALLPDSAGVMLGTSRSLRRFDRQGTQLWSKRVASELRSLTVSRDGQLVVGAQLDSTVRWWRSSDGALLLSLFVSVDGRWVLWTEQGYYDAGIGAETLIGWHVNRGDGSGVDFFSIGKFREKYHRPDVIDQVLMTLDPVQALERADAARQQLAQTDARLPPTAAEVPPSAPQPPESRPGPAVSAPAALLPDVLAKQLPPVVIVRLRPPVDGEKPGSESASQERLVNSDPTRMRLAFSLRSDAVPVEAMIVRVDGRPAEVLELAMPTRQDGRAVGYLMLKMPSAHAEVSVMAQAGAMVSEPVFMPWVWPPSSASVVAGVPPVATAPTAPALAPAAAVPVMPLAGAAKNPAARLFFVAIGVSAYARKDYDLGLPAKDAADFAALMEQQGGRQYASVQFRLLTDAAASRAAVLAALEWLRQSVGPGDTGMVFIAGHGVNDTGGRYFFMPYDADHNNLSRTSVSEAQLRGALSGIRGRAILFADTCFAGKVVGSGSALNHEIGRLANTLSAAENGVIVFSSSTGRQTSIERDAWGNGAFTKALIEGLKGGADFRKEGVVTHQGLSYFLGREVSKLTMGAQTPVTAVPLGVVDYSIASVAAR